MSLSKKSQEEIALWEVQYRRAAEEDGYVWILKQDGWKPGADDVPEGKGKGLSDAAVEAFIMLVSFRSLDQGEDPRFEGWLSAFLARQAYGRKFEAGEEGYRVGLAGAVHNIEIFVRAIDELDFEDLREVVDYSVLHVRPVGVTLDNEAAAEMVESIQEDLNYSGDEVKLEWKLKKNSLVMELVETEEED